MSSRPLDPIQLIPLFRERVWGRENLAPYFPFTQLHEHIGEVWFTAEESLTSLDQPLGQLLMDHPGILGNAVEPRYPGLCPLLLKLIFTNQRLSVQVHPDDDYAQTHHRNLGKTEAWYVLDSNPLGKVALGFQKPLSREELRKAAQSGEIEHLLAWRTVARGDVIFVPAGTVHAIGEGVTLCEIQENSDLTYRLYDYGRGRELHLEHAINVCQLGPYDDRENPVQVAEWREQLLECAFFRIELLKPKPSIRVAAELPYYAILLCIKGSGTIADHEFTPGQAWLIPAGGKEVHIHGSDSEWILTYASDRPSTRIRG